MGRNKRTKIEKSENKRKYKSREWRSKEAGYAWGKRTMLNGTEFGRDVREQVIIRWKGMVRREAVSTQE